MKKVLFILSLLVFTASFSQGNIEGVVMDKELAGSPLPFADVYLKGTTKGTTTDFDGKYVIESIDPGTYTLVISFVGYEAQEFPNTVIKDGENLKINATLSASAASLSNVIVQGTSTVKESESALLIEQKKSDVIIESIGSQELSRKGVSDAAGAVGKLAGISKQESGGNNVYVRGLGDRYLNTTFNGLPLPSNDIDKKNVDLQLFSSDIIQNIGVSKTYSPEFYGDFSAGNINIDSKQHTGKPFLDVEVGSNYNTNAVGEQFYRSEGTGFFGFYTRHDNNPFAVILSHGVDPVTTEGSAGVNGSISGGRSWDIGSESRLNVFATGSFGNGFEYLEGPATDFTVIEKKFFPNTEEYVYSRNTTLSTTLAYKINGGHSLKFTSLFINDATDRVSFFGTKGLGRNRDAIRDTDKGFYQSNVQFDQNQIYVNQLTGKNRINDVLKLDWGLGVNTVLARQPDRKRISLEGFDLGLDDDPTTNPSFFNNTDFDNQRYFQNIEDNEINGRLNLNIKASDKLKLNVGYTGRKKEREFDNIRYGYSFSGSTIGIEGGTERNLNSRLSPSNIGTLFNLSVFNGLPSIPGRNTTNLPGALENTYVGELDIHAGYIDAKYSVNEKLSVVPGLRIEKYNQSVTYDVINLLVTDPGFREAEETFFLPSLNVKYEVVEDQNLRFSLSKTVSNPEFKEVAPYVYEDVNQRIGGNPGLLEEPAFSEIFNLDLKYEWFVKRGELLSLGLFAKQINDPVNLVVANDATGTQRFFRTGDKAEVLGVEVEARKSLISQKNEDEDDVTILSAGFNATYTYTEQDLKESNGLFSTSFDRDTDKLQGASPLLLNADLNYSPELNDYKPTFTLVFSYFSDRIDALGSGRLGNIVEKSVSTLDFIWKNRLGEKLEINTYVKNILNPEIQRVREGATSNGGEITLSNYKRGLNLGLQVKYNF